MTHGAVVMPRLLGEDTAEELREHILKRNGELTADESIPLDGAENRFSYGIGTCVCVCFVFLGWLVLFDLI